MTLDILTMIVNYLSLSRELFQGWLSFRRDNFDKNPSQLRFLFFINLQLHKKVWKASWGLKWELKSSFLPTPMKDFASLSYWEKKECGMHFSALIYTHKKKIFSAGDFSPFHLLRSATFVCAFFLKKSINL